MKVIVNYGDSCFFFFFFCGIQHSLKGIVKGTGYLCGCKDCKFSKASDGPIIFHFSKYMNKLLAFCVYRLTGHSSSRL